MVKRVASNILTSNHKSTFLSCAKDQETILKKLFVESRPYSDKLKKLLIINTPDCLDREQTQYQLTIEKPDYSIKGLRDNGYIRTVPKINFFEHEEVKSYMLLEFDNFIPTNNPEYRDCNIIFSIICHLDCWELNDYGLRPWMIAGYIDGILNNSRLAGIGTLQFSGASELVLNENLGGVLLRYTATHGHDDDGKVLEDYPAIEDLIST